MPALTENVPWVPKGSYPLGTALTASSLTLTQGEATAFGPTAGTAGPDTSRDHTVLWPGVGAIPAGTYDFSLSVTAGGAVQVQTGTVTLVNASPPVLIKCAVDYTPDPSNAAFTVLENSVTYGPYAAVVTMDGAGVSSLSVTINPGPVGLVAGIVRIQPGTLIGGVFAPEGDFVNGTLGDGISGDLSLTAGPPVVNLAGDAESDFLITGYGGYVHVLLSALTSAGALADLTIYPVSLAAVPCFSDTGIPLTADDFTAGDWLTALDGTSIPAGTYARLRLPADLLPGFYFVYVLIGDSSGSAVRVVKAGDLLRCAR